MSSSYDAFRRDIREAVRSFPGLQVVTVNGKDVLRGSFPVIDDEGKEWHVFSIEIHHVEGYPFCFPVLYEVGGEIPRIADWHINEQGSCCLTVPINEVVSCKNGLSVTNFLRNHVKPYFFNQAYRLEKGVYANREYSHGIWGVWEYYEELFNEKDKGKVIEYLKIFLNLKISKSTPCFCGKKAKFRKCHPLVYKIFKILYKEDLLREVERLSKSIP